MGADGENPIASSYGVPDGAGIFHGVGEGFFDVGITAGAESFDTVEGVLKVGGGDDDSLDIFVVVEFIVVAGEGDLLLRLLGQERLAFFAPAAPDIGEGHDFEIEFAGGLQESRDEAAASAVGEADDADTDAVISAENAGVA